MLQLSGARVTTDECKSKKQRVCVWRRSGMVVQEIYGTLPAKFDSPVRQTVSGNGLEKVFIGSETICLDA